MIPENATANRANLFIAQADSFNGTGIRIADANNGGSAGLSIGVVRANASSTWATSSMEGGVAKRVTLEAGQTYIVSLVYQFDEATGQTLQFCYVNNELIFSDSTIVVGSSGGGSKLPDVNIPEGFHDFPEKNFYSIDAVSGYDEALTAEDIAALVAGQRTDSTESIPSRRRWRCWPLAWRAWPSADAWPDLPPPPKKAPRDTVLAGLFCGRRQRERA